MSFMIRKTTETDRQRISDVVIAAFGMGHGSEISGLVRDLLADPSARPSLSLAAFVNDTLVGHILFTNARIEYSQRIVPSTILAPLSVHPEHQNKGIGGQLIEEGLEQLTSTGVELVFVLGHPGYYPKYGFSAAGIKGFDAPYPIPPQNSGAWMVQKLQPGTLEGVSGKVVCAEALSDPKYWRE